VVDKKMQSCIIVDVAVSGDCRVHDKEKEKKSPGIEERDQKALVAEKSESCTCSCRCFRVQARVLING